MAFNINEFHANVNKMGGFSMSDHFMMFINPPVWANSGEYNRVLPYLVSSAVLPGISMMTTDIAHHGYGVIDKRPYLPSFNDIDISVYSDGTGKSFEFFHQWMQNIINFRDDDSMIGESVRGAAPFEVHYRENYVTTIEIVHYNVKGDKIVVYRLNDAFPLTLGDIQVNWQMTNEIVRLPLIFTFRTWSSQSLQKSDISSLVDNRRFSIVNQLARNGTLGYAFQTLNRSQSINDALSGLYNINFGLNAIGGVHLPSF